MMSPLWAGIALAGLLAQATSPDDSLAKAQAKARAGDVAGALADLRTLAAEPTPNRAEVLFGLATLEERTGDHDAARQHAMECATLRQQAGLLASAADALNLAASAEIGRARYPEAAAHLEQAMTWSAEARDWSGHAEQATNLGNVHFFVGRYDDASRLYAVAESLADTHRDEPWAARRLTIVLVNQAALEQRLGRYDAALQVQRKLKARAATLPLVEQGQMLANEGALFRRLGDPYKALAAYASARTVFSTAEHAPGELNVLTNRGIALALDLASPAAATEEFSEALALATRAGATRDQLVSTLYRGESHLRAGRADLALADFTASLELARALSTNEELWKSHYGLGKVHLLAGRRDDARAAFDQAIAVIDGLRERLTIPSTRADFFQDKREVFDARIALALDGESAATVFDLMEQSRARAWRDQLKLAPVSLALVQRALPDDTVLLSYWQAGPSAAVLRVTKTEANVRRLALHVPDIAELSAALRQPASDAWQRPAGSLAAALLPPGVLSTSSTRVIVVPDGALGAVPFDVLPIDGQPLVTRAAVSYVPTSALLVGAPREAPSRWRAPWAHQLAAFGDPTPADDAWHGSAPAARLAASADEIHGIASVLGGRHALFVGDANRKDALARALATSPAVLHLATHGMADLAQGERSRLMFSPATPGGPAESLFLREVYDLPLVGVALVVLSACDTERGPEVRGEGVQGFGRALLAAGAASAVTTLWRVSDAPTSQFMRVFYDRLQRGDRRDVALQAAKRALFGSRELAHPFYWAGFVLTGRSDAVPRAPRWRDVAGLALIAGGLGAAIAVLSARRTREPRA